MKNFLFKIKFQQIIFLKETMNMMPTPPGQPLSPGQPAKKSNALLIVSISVVVFVAMIAGFINMILSLGSPTMKASDLFLSQVAAGQIDMAYESASIQFKQEVSKADFAGFLDKHPMLKKFKSSSFNSFNIQNNFATVSGTITATDGQVSPIEVNLINENGAWHVEAVNLNPAAVENSVTDDSTILD
jgi:flagellar basal body-associated protein FliL